MSITIPPPQSVPVAPTVQPSPAVAPLHLHGVTWAIYEQLRAHEQNSGLRMIYNQGTLILMSPSRPHGKVLDLLIAFLRSWSRVNQVDIEASGTVTLKRPDLLRGAEPDACYHIMNEGAVFGRAELNLEVDPPPDLLIEIDITSFSREKLPLYAAIGVREVWLWRNEILAVLVLQPDGQYAEQPSSIAAVGFPIEAAQILLARRMEVKENALLEEFEAHLRAK